MPRTSEIGGLSDVSAQDLLDQASLEVHGKKLAQQPLSQRNAILGGAVLLVFIFLVFGFGGDGGHDLPFNWKSRLVGERPPEGPLTGVLFGELFEFDRAVLLPAARSLQIDDTLGRRVHLEVRCGREPDCAIGAVVSVTRPVTGAIERGADVPPKIVVEDTNGAPLLTTERGFVVILKIGDREGMEVPVRMYLCLQDEDQGFLGGSFRARIEE